MTTETAIAGCRRGDNTCQKYIFDSYSAAMLMVCMRYVRDLQDAEELMLGGFMKFYSSIDRLVYTGGSITAWLKKIMVNECLMFLRKRGKLNLVNEAYAAGQTEAETALGNVQLRELFRLITELPEGYRTVFNLFAVEGFSHREIAQMLGISEGTSKSQYSKARTMLQAKIKQQHLNQQQ